MVKKHIFFIATMLAISFTSFASDIFKIKLGWINGTPPAEYNVIGLSGTSPITVNSPFALKDSTGATSTLTFTQKTGTAYQQGSPSPSTTGFTYNLPYFSQSVCYGWAFNYDASTSFEIAGFTPGDAVDFVILCSRGNNASTPYTTSRLCNLTAVGSNSVSYNNYEPAGNYTELATLTSVLPDATGKITLTIAGALGAATPLATLMNAIRIKRTAASTATGISTNVTSISAMNYDAGFGPSIEKTFLVNANGLQSDITVTPPANFEISKTSTTGFVSTPISLTQSAGTVPTTVLYIRLKAGLAAGDYTGDVVLSSTNMVSKSVACAGTTANVVPALTSSVSSLNSLNYAIGDGPSVERTFSISGVGLQSSLVVTPSANLEISQTTASGFSNAALSFNPVSGLVGATTIYVRLKAGLPQSTYSENLTISSGSLSSQSIPCSGSVTAAALPNPNAARSTYADFGVSTYLTTDEGWSNMTNFATNQSVALLDGASNPFGTLTITKGFSGSSSTGTDRTTESAAFIFSGNPSNDFFYGQSAGNSSALKISGLNPSLRYDFTIFGSRVGVTPVDNRETKYIVTGLDGVQTTLLLDATNNVANSAIVKNVRPNAAGEITIDISAGPNNTNSSKGYYINAMKIVEQTGNVVLVDNSEYIHGDIMEPWHGGNTYYNKWSKSLPTSSSFFPITVFYQQTSVASQYKSVGVNCYNYLGPGSTVPTTSFDNLNSAGLFALNPYSDTYRDFPGNSVIKAWYIDHDEPDNQYGASVTPVESVMSEYKLMVDKDPTRPVMIGLGQGAAVNSWYGRGNRTNKPRDYRKYSKWADMVSFDCYPMNENRLFEAGGIDYKIRFNTEIANSIWYIANGIDNLREATDYSKPVWVWLECTNMHSLAQFDLQAYHIKAEAWMALIHGANGIGYFCHDLQPNLVQGGVLQAKYSSYLQAISDNNALITANAPILNTQTVSNAATVSTSSSSNPIDIMVKRAGGFTYLYAVSMRPGTPTATFTLRNFKGNTSVEVVGEGRTLTAVNGVFQDTFTDYGVHIYKAVTDFTKITPTVTVNVGTYNFNGAAQGPNTIVALNPTPQSVTYSYEGTGSTTYGPSATIPTNTGTYSVTATVATDVNYNSASSGATAFSIVSLQKINLDPVTGSRTTPLNMKTRTWSSTVGNASVCLWKDDKEGAFSITIDDNIEYQVNDWLANAATYHIPLTWFLINQGGTWPTNWDPSDVAASNVSNYSLYANALAAGHNIGGHDNRNWYTSGVPAGVVLPDSVKYTNRIIATKNQINTNLTTPTNGYSCLTYAYPYGSYPKSVNGDPWARNQFIALRGVLGGSNKAESANYQNLQITELLAGYPWRDNYVRTLFVDKPIGLFNRNNYRGWTIHLFHSLSSQASKDSALNLMKYLDLKRDSLWLGGFQNVAQYAQSRDSHRLTSSVVDANHIKFTLADDMNDAMFNYPLTVKVVVPNTWSSVVALQNGDTLSTRILARNGSNYLFVDAVPDGGEVTIATTKVTPTVTVNVGNYNYTGTAQGPNSIATLTPAPAVVTYSYAGSGFTIYAQSTTAPTNVGTYTVTATVESDLHYDIASSIPTAFSIDGTVPEAPTSVVATQGAAQASVAFAAPANSGGLPISGYIVKSTPGNFIQSGTNSPIVISGLTNGIAYTFTVAATNSVGSSVASDASASVMPIAVPDLPSNVIAVAGNTQAVVSFTAPASNGGSSITGYTITANPGNITKTGTGSPMIVTGLTNGTAYTFSVVATNGVGTGSASSASSSITPVASNIRYFASGDLSMEVYAANNGDIIYLTGSTYTWSTPVGIDKSLKIVADPSLTIRPIVTATLTSQGIAYGGGAGILLTVNSSNLRTITFDGISFAQNGGTAVTTLVRGKTVASSAGDLNVAINNCLVTNMCSIGIVDNLAANRTTAYNDIKITNSEFRGTGSTMGTLVSNNSLGTLFKTNTFRNNLFSGFSTNVIAQQYAGVVSTIIDHCTFDANAKRDVYIRTTSNIAATITNSIMSNSANNLNTQVNTFGTAGTLLNNRCGVYYTGSGTVATIYPGYSNAYLTSNPAFDANYFATGSYVNAGLDGNSMGYYNAATITANATFSPFSYSNNGPSTAQSFTVSGANLNSGLLINAPAGFELCLTTSGNYSSSLFLEPTLGTVAATDVYVRLTAGLAPANYNGNVVITSAKATTVNLSCTGTVYFNIEATSSDDAMGSVAGAGLKLANESVTLVATPASSSYRFVGWTENGNPLSIINPYMFNANISRVLVAQFAVNSQNAMPKNFSTNQDSIANKALSVLPILNNPNDPDAKLPQITVTKDGILQINNLMDRSSVWVFDAFGRCFYCNTNLKDRKEIYVPSDGVYIIKVQSGKHRLIKKTIIRKE